MRRTPFIGQINGVFLCHAELNILMNYAKRYCVNMKELFVNGEICIYAAVTEAIVLVETG